MVACCCFFVFLEESIMKVSICEHLLRNAVLLHHVLLQAALCCAVHRYTVHTFFFSNILWRFFNDLDRHSHKDTLAPHCVCDSTNVSAGNNIFILQREEICQRLVPLPFPPAGRHTHARHGSFHRFSSEQQHKHERRPDLFPPSVRFT